MPFRDDEKLQSSLLSLLRIISFQIGEKKKASAEQEARPLARKQKATASCQQVMGFQGNKYFTIAKILEKMLLVLKCQLSCNKPFNPVSHRIKKNPD